MKGYESIIIVDAALSDEEATEALDKYKKLIETEGGNIAHENTWGRRKLAYEVNKKRHGIYFFLYVSANGEILEKLRIELGYDERILKSFFVGVDNLEIAHTHFEKLKADPEMTVNLLSEKGAGDA